MKEKIERKQDLDKFMQYMYSLRDIWGITREEMSDAYDILLKCQNKQELSLVEVNKINRHPISMYLRESILKYMGFVILTTELMDDLAEYLQGKRVIEVMAGCGSMSKLLQDRGINIKATDNELWATHDNSNYTEWQDAWTYIENIDILDATHKYGPHVDIFIISWPPYKSTLPLEMMKILSDMNSKAQIIYIGEGKGGCTADDNFYRHVDYINEVKFKKIQNSYISWKGFGDSINIVKLKTT